MPPATSPVVDQAGLLSPGERAGLGAALERYEQTSGNPLAVLIVRTLDGESIEQYAMRVAEAWKHGSAERDNGVLLVVATEDRAWRIEVGNGIEGELTDAQAARIGRGILVPALREGRAFYGIAGTLQAIAAALGGELGLDSGPAVTRAPREPVRFSFGTLIFFLFILMLLFGGRGRRGGGFFTGMLLGSLLGGGFRGGRSHRGRGFGGGSWGGGGGFSGGGASGRW